ncbi:MAG TPA: hypothetical protein VFL88_07145 [Gemmatimonadales bacterium]|nr:hypothetical protein [Gemmatimonadales bacterium]
MSDYWQQRRRQRRIEWNRRCRSSRSLYTSIQLVFAVGSLAIGLVLVLVAGSSMGYLNIGITFLPLGFAVNTWRTWTAMLEPVEDGAE